MFSSYLKSSHKLFRSPPKLLLAKLQRRTNQDHFEKGKKKKNPIPENPIGKKKLQNYMDFLHKLSSKTSSTAAGFT